MKLRYLLFVLALALSSDLAAQVNALPRRAIFWCTAKRKRARFRIASRYP